MDTGPLPRESGVRGAELSGGTAGSGFGMLLLHLVRLAQFTEPGGCLPAQPGFYPGLWPPVLEARGIGWEAELRLLARRPVCNG